MIEEIGFLEWLSSVFSVFLPACTLLFCSGCARIIVFSQNNDSPQISTTLPSTTNPVIGTTSSSFSSSENPGKLDPAFSRSWKLTTNLNRSDVIRSTTTQSDGKILVAGNSDNATNSSYDFAVVRYNTDGSLDTSFNSTGSVTDDFGSHDYARSIAVQSDGKIVVTGQTYSFSHSNYDFAVLRYNTDGTLDTTFNGTGKLTLDFGGDDDARSVAIQSDGKIVVGGTAHNGTNDDFALVRLNSDGSLDTSFSGTGKLMSNFGAQDRTFSIAIQSDGKIVIAGESNSYSSSLNFTVVRYNSDGTLDTSFNGTGIATTAFFASHEEAYSVAIQNEGKILVAGYAPSASNNDFALVRYNSDGTLDTSF